MLVGLLAVDWAAGCWLLIGLLTVATGLGRLELLERHSGGDLAKVMVVELA